MRQVDEHIHQLLGISWTYRDYQCKPHHVHGDYCVDARDDEVSLRFHGFLVATQVLPRFADLQRVHKVLEELFNTFPKYTGSPDDDVPFC